jgi:hypothetical protein
MRFRKLRITWTVLCGIACVLLCLLWVRSNLLRDYFWANSSRSMLGITSMHGGILFQISFGPTDLGPNPEYVGIFSESNDDWLPYWETVAGTSKLGFELTRFPNEFVLPDWFVVTVILILAALPWIRWRFTTRSLLVAITAVAVVLG